MGWGVAVIHSSLFLTSCWLRESIPHSLSGWYYAQLPTMDHDYSKPVMPILFFYASNLSRAELVIQVHPKSSKVGGRAWMRWGAGMVLMRESWEMREPSGPVPPFLTCSMTTWSCENHEMQNQNPEHGGKEGWEKVFHDIIELLAILGLTLQTLRLLF